MEEPSLAAPDPVRMTSTRQLHLGLPRLACPVLCPRRQEAGYERAQYRPDPVYPDETACAMRLLLLPPLLGGTRRFGRPLLAVVSVEVTVLLLFPAATLALA